MAIRRRKALLGGGALTPYVDLWFSAGSFRVATTQVGTLTGLAGYTFTGASLRMGFGPTGYLTYGPNNLARESQASTLWTAAGTTPPTTTGGVSLLGETCTSVTFTSGSATGFAGSRAERSTGSGSTTVLAGTPHVLSEYISLSRPLVGSEQIIVYWTGYQAASNVVLNAASSGAYVGAWVRGTNLFSAQATSGQIYPVVYLANAVASDVTVYICRVQLEAVTYQTTPSTYYPTTSAAYYGARLVYDSATLASLGILVEEARTNLCLQSQTFDNATWSKGASSVTANAVTSPDGTANADKVVEDSTTANHRVSQTITVSNATVYTYSIYVKAGERTWGFFEVVSGATDLYCYVNLATGALGTTNTTPTVTAVGNGWYRVVITFTSATTSATVHNHITTGNGTTSYAGDGTSGAYFWQAQLE